MSATEEDPPNAHPRSRARRLVAGGASVAGGLVLAGLLVLADACWLEPQELLLTDVVRLPLASRPLRLAHLSDLHIATDTPLLHRLLAEVAAARPDFVLISGDLIKDAWPLGRHTAAAAAFLAQLRRVAPVLAVQGHSEYQGEVITGLEQAGLTWLSNEGRRLGPDGPLLLGLNQQVGIDSLARNWPNPFHPVQVDGEWHYGAQRGEPYHNFYSHYDPAPAGLADTSGPLAWSSYDTTCDVWIDNVDAGAGIGVHSRYVLGEDRMIRLRRDRPEPGHSGTFSLVLHGTAWTGGKSDDVDTGVDPEPGRWYRLRLRTEVEDGAVRVRARVWPAESPEPRRWQAHAEDRSSERITSGTVGLWAWGGGTVAYRNLRVVSRGGDVLLDDPLGPLAPERGIVRPAGWREGARATRLALALARSPEVPPGTPLIVLSHSPDVALEASRRGVDLVLAGHTHGGQIRLPVLGALTTRSSLGPFFAEGRFELAAPNARGLTTLYVNPGVGTSILPIRFLCPPRWALVDLTPLMTTLPGGPVVQGMERRGP